MTKEQKEKVKSSMLEYLKSIGYPNISADKIIEALPNLWKKLEKDGLLSDIPNNFRYTDFVHVALTEKSKWEHLKKMQSIFNNFSFRR